MATTVCEREMRVGVVVGDVRKSAFDLVKIENQSHKQSHKFDAIGVGRIRTYSVYDSVAYAPVKTRLSESDAEAEEPTNHKAQSLAL